jgi:MFS family permease
VGAYFGRTFYALGNSQYRILWFGTLFSFLGMQMQVMARGYLAYDLTHRNSALGGVMLAFGVPQLVLGLWGGVLADRLPKRSLLVICQAIVAANSGWLAFMIETDRVEFWMLIVAGFVQGGGFAFIGPARQAFISDLVGKDAIGNAVVLQQLSMNSTRVVGPSLAGTFIAISFIGIGGVYMMTTLGFIIAAVTMLRLPPGNPAPRANRLSALGDMRAGLSYVRSRPSVAILIVTSLMVVMIGFPYQSFLPSIARDVYEVDAGGLGNLQSVGAIGAVVATVFVATYAGHRRAWSFQPVLGMAFGLSLMGLALAPHFVAGLVAMVFVGGLASSFQSLNNSLTMSMSDHEYHGRVQSISMLSWSLFGIVALPIGMVADSIGIRETISLMGAFVILSVLIIQATGRIRHIADDRFATSALRERAGFGAGGQ